MTKKTIQIVGPYFTNYSLAKVNRNLAIALNKIESDYETYLYCDKDKIDWLPSKEDLNKIPDIKEFVKFEPIETDIAIYNNFPKSINNLHGLKDLKAKVKLMYTAWEDNSYPEMWVDEINENLNGVMVASKFVKETLITSGVKIPIYVISNALDEDLKHVVKRYTDLNTSKKFKFLHVSTAKQRKGVDLLLKAYFKEFNAQDDCSLIIKSFPGPDNIVDQLIAELKTENPPEVIHINSSEFTEEDIASLNLACDCAVYPTRGEGFGLPILEAMQLGVPVITTGYGGQMDFCNYQNSYLLDYKLEISTKNEIVNLNSYWAEPDFDQLCNYLKHVYINSQSEKEEQESIIKKAKESANKISWIDSAKKTIEFINKVKDNNSFRDQNIAVMTFLNDQTGINFYSKELYKNIEKIFNKFYYLSNSDIADRTESDAENVIRNWETGESEFNKVLEFLKENEINIFHIQYHPGAFTPESLNEFLQKLKSLNVSTYITLHSVKSTGFDLIKTCTNLSTVNKVIFHNKADFNYASETLNNCQLMRIPRAEFQNRNKKSLKQKLRLENYYPIISTHGLLNTNKGVDQVIEATRILKQDYPNILFLSLSAVSANNIHAFSLYEQLINQIRSNNLEDNVTIIKEFLDRKVVEVLLQCVDVNILAYIDTAGESASAAVEKTLASGNPTIVTDIKAFEELSNEVLKIKDNNADTIANSVKNLLNNPDKSEKIVEAAILNIEESSYVNKALDTLSFYL